MMQMVFQNWGGGKGPAARRVLGLVVLTVGMLAGLGLYLNRQNDAPAKVAAANLPVAGVPLAASVTPAEAASAAEAASDAASVTVENGVVKFYFASGKAALAAGAGDALAGLVKRADGRKLMISGFHDATGDATGNAALARQRGLAVQDALKAAGLSPQQIELSKAHPAAGSGSDAEARRVEVSLK